MYQFCNGDINKFVLLLKNISETLLLDKKAFYSELYSEAITDEDYTHYKKVFKKLGLKNLGDYHDLYVQRDALLLADVFENFRNKCIEIYELGPAHFLLAPGLAWEGYLKKTGVKLELLIDIGMLLMVENGITGGIYQVIHRHAKANNKYIKNYDRNIESSYLMHLDANNLYGWAMSQKLPVGDFERVKDLPQFKEDFIKNYDENSDKGYFL